MEKKKKDNTAKPSIHFLICHWNTVRNSQLCSVYKLRCYSTKCLKHNFLITKHLIYLLTNICFVKSNIISFSTKTISHKRTLRWNCMFFKTSTFIAQENHVTGQCHLGTLVQKSQLILVAKSRSVLRKSYTATNWDYSTAETVQWPDVPDVR